MNTWRRDNPRAFRDQVHSSNIQTTCSGKVKCTGEHFSWYSSDDFRAIIELPSCWHHKPGGFLAVRTLSWNMIIDEDDSDENLADPGEPSGGRSGA